MAIDVFLFASWIGGVAFALSGFLVGVRKELDLMGVFIIALITGNGGGVIRDLFLQKTPTVLTDLSALYLCAGTFLFGVVLHYLKSFDIENRGVFVLSDAIGLVAFSFTGTLAGLDAGLNIFGVTVLSFITATGGGIVRDILVNEVPSILKSEFYGSVAIVVALVMYALDHSNMATELNILAVFLSALFLRLLAHKMGWGLPRLKL